MILYGVTIKFNSNVPIIDVHRPSSISTFFFFFSIVVSCICNFITISAAVYVKETKLHQRMEDNAGFMAASFSIHLSLSNLNLFVLLPSETNFSSEQVTTTIGYGSPIKANLYSVHGSALDAKEVDATRKNLGWPFEPFYVPEDVNKHWSRHVPDGAALETEWNANFADYEKKYKEEAAELKSISTGELPAGWEKALPTYSPENPADATRNLSQQCLNALTKVKAGVENQGDFCAVRNWMRSEYINDLVTFVNWLDEELSFSIRNFVIQI
ncbi:hypothetical protein RHMOL_Rhmol04G0310400 [Rhododendron molle]|nr:hypothetical protein RHMOL_Rhmol04G0310400 [Rhododendron molle]